MSPVPVIRAVVVVVTMVPPRADADIDARPLEVHALRHGRRGGSDRQRADEGKRRQGSRQDPSHVSPLQLVGALFRTASCSRIQVYNVLPPARVRRAGGTSLNMS